MWFRDQHCLIFMCQVCLSLKNTNEFPLRTVCVKPTKTFERWAICGLHSGLTSALAVRARIWLELINFKYLCVDHWNISVMSLDCFLQNSSPRRWNDLLLSSDTDGSKPLLLNMPVMAHDQQRTTWYCIHLNENEDYVEYLLSEDRAI